MLGPRTDECLLRYNICVWIFSQDCDVIATDWKREIVLLPIFVRRDWRSRIFGLKEYNSTVSSNQCTRRFNTGTPSQVPANIPPKHHTRCAGAMRSNRWLCALRGQRSITGNMRAHTAHKMRCTCSTVERTAYTHIYRYAHIHSFELVFENDPPCSVGTFFG